MECSREKNRKTKGLFIEAFFGFSVSTLKFPILSWAIRLLQKGRFSHAFCSVYIRDRKKWYVIDATGNGVRVRSMEMFLKENKIVKKYYLPQDEFCNNEVLFWGLDKTGLEYPKMEVFGNLIQLMFRIKKNPFGQGQNKPRCNELVAMIIERFLKIKIHHDLDSIDLLYLEKFLDENIPNIITS